MYMHIIYILYILYIYIYIYIYRQAREIHAAGPDALHEVCSSWVRRRFRCNECRRDLVSWSFEGLSRGWVGLSLDAGWKVARFFRKAASTGQSLGLLLILPLARPDLSSDRGLVRGRSCWAYD